MILQALTEYYERLAEQGIVSKPGWSTTKVSDAIVLDFDGQIIGVLPLKEVIIRGTKKDGGFARLQGSTDGFTFQRYQGKFSLR